MMFNICKFMLYSENHLSDLFKIYFRKCTVNMNNTFFNNKQKII